MPTARPCRGCGQLIYLDPRYMPRNVSNDEPHWSVCPEAAQFRKPKEKEPARPPPNRQLTLPD